MNTQVIGYVGENGTRDVLIPVGHLLEQWPGLSPSILMVPVGGADDDAYPVDSELVGSDLVWHVSAGDTAAIGTTKASVRMTAIDGRVALDEPFTVIVSQNLSAGGTPPSPIQPWVDKLAELAPRAEKAADDAAKAANRANDAAQNWEKGTAANASKLGGKAPKYYLTPVNLLDNSNFANPVAQAGLNAKHGTGTYICDRWLGGGITAEQHDGYLRISTTTRGNQIRQNVSAALQGKAITVACKAVANKTFYVGLYYDVDGTTQSIAYSSTSGVNGVVCKTGTVPANAMNLRVNIYPAYVNDGGYADVYWTALYEGEYTAETLPLYVPKPYAVELAECQRYYLPIITNPVGFGYAFSSGDVVIANIPLPQPMRAVPSLPTGTVFTVKTVAGESLSTSTYTVFKMAGNGLQVNLSGISVPAGQPCTVAATDFSLNLDL